VSRDGQGTFDPQTAPEHQRHFNVFLEKISNTFARWTTA
jgi:hypothetical protein